jgi:hypothetical protein
MTIEILADGTIKSTTDPISAANHDNCERFVRAMSVLAGGETTREKRTDPEAMARRKHHVHDHEHGHVHNHDVLKGGHSH